MKAVERVCQALLVIAQKRGFTLSDVSEMFSYRKQRLSPFLPRRGQKSYGMRFRIRSPPATSQLARLQEARPEATLQRPGTLATLDSDEEVATLGERADARVRGPRAQTLLGQLAVSLVRNSRHNRRSE